MCFSAEASFAAGTALVPAGVYCLAAAARKKPAHLPLAAVPLLFGVQQFAEGVVWHALEHGRPELVRPAALVFLFFALAFWPFWFPFLTAVTDTRPAGRRAFATLAVLATAWFVVLYLPLLTGPESLLQVRVVHHSIRYDFPDLAVYQYVPRTPLRVLYLLCVALPMALGSEGWGRVPGLILAASAAAAFLLFEYAF